MVHFYRTFCFAHCLKANLIQCLFFLVSLQVCNLLDKIRLWYGAILGSNSPIRFEFTNDRGQKTDKFNNYIRLKNKEVSNFELMNFWTKRIWSSFFHQVFQKFIQVSLYMKLFGRLQLCARLWKLKFLRQRLWQWV